MAASGRVRARTISDIRSRGETLALDRAEVDLADGALHVRANKQNKHREVPLHDTTTQALRDYSRLRDRSLPRPTSPAFFVSPPGRAADRRRVQRDIRGAHPPSRPGSIVLR